MMMNVLGLDIAGNPFAWLSPEEAVSYYAKGKVAWELGDRATVFRGGHTKNGDRSMIEVKPIIAVSGSDIMAAIQRENLPLGGQNDLLFKRDRYLCAYCGEQFAKGRLTRDHIVPRSKGGPDSWQNCVTACLECNQDKGAKSLSEWGRDLLYVPYVPNRWEHFILAARKGILGDQMAYLTAKLPKHSRVL